MDISTIERTILENAQRMPAGKLTVIPSQIALICSVRFLRKPVPFGKNQIVLLLFALARC